MRGESSPPTPLKTPDGLTVDVIVPKVAALVDGREKLGWLSTLKAWAPKENSPPSKWMGIVFVIPMSVLI
jgi:hypothetical protein